MAQQSRAQKADSDLEDRVEALENKMAALLQHPMLLSLVEKPSDEKSGG